MSLEAATCDLDSFARKNLPSKFNLYDDLVPAVPLRVSDSLGSSPTHVFERLLRRLRQLVVPALVAESRKDYFDVLHGSIGEFVKVARAASTVLESFDPLATEGDDLNATAREAFREAGERMAGDAGADEVVFALKTYDAAVRLWDKLASLSPGEDHAVEGLKRTFIVHSVLMQMALIALVEAADRAKSTPTGIEVTFEIVRGSSLRTFAAVREAIALKTPAIPVPEGEAPFDEEDARLAAF